MAQSIASNPTHADIQRSDRTDLLHITLFTLLRVGAGLLFAQHGAMKLFGSFGGTAVPLVSQMGLAGVLELFGGLMLAFGILTRPVAVIQVALMIAAYFIGHASAGLAPIVNGGELALLYALVFALIAVAGPGKWSLDGWFRLKGNRAPSN